MTYLRMKFKAVRKAAGLSPKECGKLLGVSERSIFAWEKGTRTLRPIFYEELLRKTGQKEPS